jgi:hypothetical protein
MFCNTTLTTNGGATITHTKACRGEEACKITRCVVCGGKNGECTNQCGGGHCQSCGQSSIICGDAICLMCGNSIALCTTKGKKVCESCSIVEKRSLSLPTTTTPMSFLYGNQKRYSGTITSLFPCLVKAHPSVDRMATGILVRKRSLSLDERKIIACLS